MKIHPDLAPLAAAALAVATSSCALTADEISCTLKNAQGQPERCIEYRDFSTAASVNGKASLQILCEGFGADVDDRGCEIAGALVGCEENYQDAWIQTEWFWATEDKKTAASFACDGGDKRLGPDRQPISDPVAADMSTAVCSPATATAAVTITFQNDTSGVVTLYWVNASCAEVQYSSIAAGASHSQQTFALHPWRIRAGMNDPAGAILKEFSAQPSDAPTVIVTIP